MEPGTAVHSQGSVQISNELKSTDTHASYAKSAASTCDVFGLRQYRYQNVFQTEAICIIQYLRDEYDWQALAHMKCNRTDYSKVKN